MQARNKPVILFMAEAVTLAHFARIVALAKTLDPKIYSVIIASDPRYIELEAPLDCIFHPIYSIPTSEFTQALAHGQPLYNTKTLIRYVEEDLTLLDTVKPDLVVGDFRLSLAVSAPLRKVPYASIVNAYWSPYALIDYPIPDLYITKLLGIKLAQKFFDFARSIIFSLHAQPLNQVRHHFGLPSLGRDLRNTYTWGNYTLYADLPEWIPMLPMPPCHHFIGPVLWSTHTPLPEWWHSLPMDRPIIGVMLGSSGQSDLLSIVLATLSKLPVIVVAATGEKKMNSKLPVNTFVAEYLPIAKMVERVQILICNGGSLTTSQALANGVPVIGLCSNMDQLLNMQAVERLGAGFALRAGQLTENSLLSIIDLLLKNASYAVAAAIIGKKQKQVNFHECFQSVISGILFSPSLSVD